jgi:chitin disaccharide deacetylase
MTRPEALEARRLLVVNADDYGLTEATCRAILRAHRFGIVTSTSVLAVGRAFERCGHWLRDHPRLGVGVHLAIVGGDSPLLPPQEIRTLVDDHGRFFPSWRALLARALLRPLDRAELARELGAQIRRVASLGVRVTHLDSHQHLHLLPGVREAVLELACRFAVPIIRVPRSRGGRVWGPVLNLLSSRLRVHARAAGLRFPEDSFGFDEAGALDQGCLDRTLALMGRSAARSIELVTHPGLDSDPERGRYAWGFRWGDELRALTADTTRRNVRRNGLVLVSYAALWSSGQVAWQAA